MKFSQYNPVVAPNTIQGTPVQAQNIPVEHPSGARASEAWASAFGQLAAFAQKQQDEKDSADVMSARNEIMSNLTGAMYGENGLFTTGVGRNAQGLTDRVTQTIQQTFKEVSGKYNRRVQQALQSNLNENMANFQRIAAQQEGREFTKQKDADYVANMSMAADRITASYFDPQSVNSILDDSFRILQYRAKDQGWSGAQYEAEKRKTLTGLLSGAIEGAIDNGDFEGASAMLNTYKGGMSQDFVMKWEAKLRGEKGIQRNITAGEDLFARFGDDEVAAKAYLDTLRDEMENVGGGGSISTIDGLMAAIGGQESGGDYDAENGRTGAHGKYQIMPENWPSWAEEAGLGADAPRTPENQEKVAKYKLSQYLQQYGPEGAMVAWYSGPANAERWAKGESTDVYGRSWDAKNGNGDEPSIREYVQQVSARGGGGVSFNELDGDIDADGVELTGTEPRTIGMINKANQIHKQMFGTPIWVSCTTGGHAAGTSHAKGLKADIGSDELRDNPEAREKFEAALKAEGIGAVDEYTHPSANSTGGHFDLNVTGEDWYNGTNHGGFKGGAGGGGYTRHKYTERDITAIWQNYIARKNETAKARAAESQQRVDGLIGQLGSMSETEVVPFLERIRAGVSDERTLQEYNKVKSAAGSLYPDLFRKSGGSGSGSGNERTYYNGASGSRYTANQIEDAKALFDEYEERRNDPAETISRTDQRRYNKAARILNDVQGNSGDNLSSKEGLQLARHAVSVTSSDEEAEWYLIVNGEFSESEAKAYVEMVHGDEEG